MAALAVYAAERTRESIFRVCTIAERTPRAAIASFSISPLMGGRWAASIVRTRRPSPSRLALLRSGLETRRTATWFRRSNRTPPPSGSGRRDPDFRVDGSAYYYVRVVQTNHEESDFETTIWVN